MTRDTSQLRIDRSYLQNVQYRTDKNLAARQSIYRFQQPYINLPAAVLDVATVRGDETVVDVGCGNGVYLAELMRRGHRGRVLGIDFSAGMLLAARSRARAAGLAIGEASVLPIRDHAASLTVAAHMLYHVSDPRAAVIELRRITQRSGTVIVVLNGQNHLRELRDLIADTLQVAMPAGPSLPLDAGQELLGTIFGSVMRHDFTSELSVPDPGPIESYARSVMNPKVRANAHALATAVADRLRRSGKPFRIRTETGCLVCN
jgi:ubiquinone/menaquinone biosynthesis C-methylase UbiE